MKILPRFLSVALASFALALALAACDDGGSSGGAVGCSTSNDCGAGQYCKTSTQRFFQTPGVELSAPPGVDCEASCQQLSAACPQIPEATCNQLCETGSDACFGCIAAAGDDCSKIQTCAATACVGGGAAGSGGNGSGGSNTAGTSSNGTAGTSSNGFAGGSTAPRGTCTAIPSSNGGAGGSNSGGSNSGGSNSGGSNSGGSNSGGAVPPASSSCTDPGGKACGPDSVNCRIRCTCASGVEYISSDCTNNVCGSASEVCNNSCEGKAKSYCNP